MHAQTLLRFSTAGSVDDGKSTLIGRLLYDAKSIFEDQLSALVKTTARRGGVGGNKEVDLDVDLALLTDGLIAEREQGITIDVAYRYFATPKRKFIIADTPGHEQYTRNMVTGASTAELTIVLVDASKGILPQSRRHALVSALLGIRHVVVAVNKMDLVDWSEERFDALVRELNALAVELGMRNLQVVPLSALFGDMVVERGERLPWYRGKTLLEILESASVSPPVDEPLRLPVQLVSRPGLAGAYVRGYMGRIEAGAVAIGDEIVVLPGGHRATVNGISTYDGLVPEARAPQSITLLLDREIDISRGDMIASAAAAPTPVRQFKAMVCWMDQQPLDLSRKYLIKHTTRTSKALIEAVDYRLDVATLRADRDASTLATNDIGLVSFKVRDEMLVDRYTSIRSTGGFIVIDEQTNHTVAAGMVGDDACGVRVNG